ncbi:MAG TPA: DinB family protein [Reyranella sp.]|nr:DinB family protein [Reyranella sp.]
MIDCRYAPVMAAYNAEMNRRLFAAAGRLPDEARRLDRGAFWRSIHGTLCHQLWGDRIWMALFAGWPRPGVAMAESAGLHQRFDELQAARVEADAGITQWAEALDEAWLAGESTWLSGAAGREMRKPNRLLVVHFFNHQTHHRGQVHDMLTAAGQRTGDTDLFLIV